MPKVSVIVPVYGVEKYIERCARSLFEQTLDDIEYLFIDDCTPDRSIEILQQVLEDYPQRKPQVVIHRMEKNSGQAAVRKWGMQNATGEYVIHCDSDDWVDTDMYRAMYEKAKDEVADIVVCDYNITDGKKYNRLSAYLYQGDNYIEGFILRRNKCSLCNKIIKRDLIQNNKIVYPSDNYGEDLALILQLVLYANKISYISKPFYNYFVNSESITNKPSTEAIISRWQQYVNNILIVENIYKNKGLYEIYKNEFVSLKFSGKQTIIGALNSKGVYKMWRNSFSEINFVLLLNKYIHVKDKLKYIFIYLGIYIVTNYIKNFISCQK
ncbi:MAG: glycosyltransferase [Aeriscardovia sp.]|nr:glycosyltransferase [Aeriscardovia sp.]